MTYGDTILIPQQIELYQKEPILWEDSILYINENTRLEENEKDLVFYYKIKKDFPTPYQLWTWILQQYEKHYYNSVLIYYNIYRTLIGIEKGVCFDLLEPSLEEICKQYVHFLFNVHHYMNSIHDCLYGKIQHLFFYIHQLFDCLSFLVCSISYSWLTSMYSLYSKINSTGKHSIKIAHFLMHTLYIVWE